MRPSLSLAAIGAVLSSVPDAHAMRLAIAPLAGKAAQPCTSMLTEIARAEVELIPWRSGAGRPPPSSWAELSRWLLANGVRIGADVVVLGFVAGQRIVLEAYDRHQLKLIGLRHLTTAKRCRFSPSERESLSSWFRSVAGKANDYPGDRIELGRSSSVAEALEGSKAPSIPSNPNAAAWGSSLPPAETPPTVAPSKAAKPETMGARPIGPRSIVAELEIAIVGRELAYSRPSSSDLKGFGMGTMLTPGISIEAYPLAIDPSSSLRSVSIGAHYRHSVGAHVSSDDGGHDARLIELGASLGFLLETELGLALHPHVAYRRTSIGLGATSRDQRGANLPDVAYGSIELALDALLPLGASFAATGALSYLVVLSGGEVFTGAFFPNGTALGLGAEAGFSVQIAPALRLGVVFAYERYSLSLASGPDDRFGAEGAMDSLLALRSTVRFEL